MDAFILKSGQNNWVRDLTNPQYNGMRRWSQNSLFVVCTKVWEPLFKATISIYDITTPQGYFIPSLTDEKTKPRRCDHRCNQLPAPWLPLTRVACNCGFWTLQLATDACCWAPAPPASLLRVFHNRCSFPSGCDAWPALRFRSAWGVTVSNTSRSKSRSVAPLVDRWLRSSIKKMQQTCGLLFPTFHNNKSKGIKIRPILMDDEMPC